MSVRENIAFGRPDAPLAEVIAAARAAQADEFIRALTQGYDTVVGERGYTLSGGQRQRIALARLFLMNPPVLVLDDATSAVDVQVEARILAALAELMHGRTNLLIGHREPTLRLADRVLLLEGGRIIASGTHAELLQTNELYARLAALQFADLSTAEKRMAVGG
jgi:ATP-binding cassette subfamily B protein